QKGLTDEEIELACQKAGAFALDKASMSEGPLVVPRSYYDKPSTWIKAKDVANSVDLFSISSYSLYSLWKVSYLYVKSSGFLVRPLVVLC
ncbi:unnamed protein product, partial [Allacma fusca]